ncbi:MFS transporter [Photorhabdus bodei]|nr:MFS transporter [Photorhabdus bodei]
MVDRKYYLCLLGYYINIGILGVYIPWKLLELTGTATAVGAMLCIRALPGLLIGSFTGKIVDRMDKRKLVALSCFISILCLAIFILCQSVLMNATGLYIIIAVGSISNTIFLASIKSYLHVMTENQQCVGVANSKSETSIQLGNIIGTAAGGALTALSSPTLTLGLVSLILAYVAFQVMFLPEEILETVHDEKSGPKVAETGSLLQQPVIFPVLSIMLIPMIFLQMFNILLGPISKEGMHITAEGFGYLNASYSLGAVAMSLALNRLIHTRSSLLLFVSGLSVAIFNMLLPFSTSLVTGVVATMLIGATIVWARVMANAVLMQKVNSSQAGQLQALILNMHYCTVFIAGLLFGYLADKFGYQSVYFSMAMLVVFLMFIGLAVVLFVKKENMASKALKLSDAGEE